MSLFEPNWWQLLGSETSINSDNVPKSFGEDVEKMKPLCTLGANADWCRHCRKQYGGF